MILLVLLWLGRPEVQVTAAALEMVGAPYVWGGEDVDGVDCSGLLTAAARRAGYVVRRTTTRRLHATASREIPAIGRLPLFGNPVHHVGIWLDPGETMVHASSSRGVIVSDAGGSSWWGRRYTETVAMPVEGVVDAVK